MSFAPPRPAVLKGLTLGFCAYALFAMQDAAMKWLVVRYPLAEIMSLRSAAIVVVLVLSVRGRRALDELARSDNKPALLARGVLILLAWSLFFSASAYLALADLTTLYFVAPVIAVALSALVLRENVTLWRWAAIGLGFAGVAVAAGPMAKLSAVPVAAALGAAVCWGIAIVLMSWIGRVETSLVQLLSTNAIFVLGCLLPMLWAWRTPDVLGVVLILGTGLVSGLGQFLVFEGFRLAPASAVAPVEYTGLVWAGIYGFAIWGDVPSVGTMAGAALIVVASLVLVWSESRAPVAA